MCAVVFTDFVITLLLLLVLVVVLSVYVNSILIKNNYARRQRLSCGRRSHRIHVVNILREFLYLCSFFYSS